MCEVYDIDYGNIELEDISPSNTKIIKLNAILDAFVNLHKGIKQRDENWYKAMATTIGGSEVGALLGISINEELHKYKSPYSNFNEVYFYNSLLIFLHFSLEFHKNYMDKPIN